jgi:hypothetical protein
MGFFLRQILQKYVVPWLANTWVMRRAAQKTFEGVQVRLLFSSRACASLSNHSLLGALTRA